VNVWKYVPFLLTFGRLINASIWKPPWRGAPKHPQFLRLQEPPHLGITLLAPVQGPPEIHLPSWPPWSRHPTFSGRDNHLTTPPWQPHNCLPSNKLPAITKVIILIVAEISNMWLEIHRYDTNTSSPGQGTTYYKKCIQCFLVRWPACEVRLGFRKFTSEHVQVSMRESVGMFSFMFNRGSLYRRIYPLLFSALTEKLNIVWRENVSIRYHIEFDRKLSLNNIVL
jgi:hypothetical protein